MKYFLAFILCCCAAQAPAQQFIERVYLKDSITFYEGYVIEQAPAKYVKIYRLKEKDTVQVSLTDVWKLTKVYDVQKKANKTTVLAPKRYYKSAFLELGGRALLYSLNFDMRTERGRRNGWGFTAGLTTLGINAVNSSVGDSVRSGLLLFPFSVNYLFGKKKGFFELGLGATYIFASANGRLGSGSDDNNIILFDNSIGSIFGTLTIGYRHMPLRDGITWRVNINPLFLGGSAFVPWLGLSIGYQFW